jgi:hypothetical protein
LGVYDSTLYRDKKVVGDNIAFFRAPLQSETRVKLLGFKSYINAGTVQIEGIEFSANFSNKFSDDFNMSLGYNVTVLRNVTYGYSVYQGGSFGIGQQAPSECK